jgi:hypothetical protein
MQSEETGGNDGTAVSRSDPDWLIRLRQAAIIGAPIAGAIMLEADDISKALTAIEHLQKIVQTWKDILQYDADVVFAAEHRADDEIIAAADFLGMS